RGGPAGFHARGSHDGGSAMSSWLGLRNRSCSGSAEGSICASADMVFAVSSFFPSCYRDPPSIATGKAALIQSITHAAEALIEGKLVAFPTETVYGLGADATQDRAVAQVFDAKNRPNFNPLIVHVASLDEAVALGEFEMEASELAKLFWPGPLTLVVPRRE